LSTPVKTVDDAINFFRSFRVESEKKKKNVFPRPTHSTDTAIKSMLENHTAEKNADSYTPNFSDSILKKENCPPKQKISLKGGVLRIQPSPVSDKPKTQMRTTTLSNSRPTQKSETVESATRTESATSLASTPSRRSSIYNGPIRIAAKNTDRSTQPKVETPCRRSATKSAPSYQRPIAIFSSVKGGHLAKVNTPLKQTDGTPKRQVFSTTVGSRLSKTPASILGQAMKALNLNQTAAVAGKEKFEPQQDVDKDLEDEEKEIALWEMDNLNLEWDHSIATLDFVELQQDEKMEQDTKQGSKVDDMPSSQKLVEKSPQKNAHSIERSLTSEEGAQVLVSQIRCKQKNDITHGNFKASSTQPAGKTIESNSQSTKSNSNVTTQPALSNVGVLRRSSRLSTKYQQGQVPNYKV